MANLTQPRPDGRQEGILVDIVIAASTKLFAGSLVNSNSGGYAKKASTTRGEAFAGVAMETIDNSAGANGDKYVRVWKEGVFDLDCASASASQAWVGQDVYAVDDHTVALAATTTTNEDKVGRVVQFNSATSVRVKI